MAKYRLNRSLLITAILATVVTSLPWNGGGGGWGSSDSEQPQQRNDPTRNGNSFQGAMCRITQNGRYRAFGCYPSNLFNCESVEEIPEYAANVGITALSVCVPISCEEGGYNTCYNADYDSRCADSSAFEENDFRQRAQAICPDLNNNNDDDFNDRNNQPPNDDDNYEPPYYPGDDDNYEPPYYPGDDDNYEPPYYPGDDDDYEPPYDEDYDEPTYYPDDDPPARTRRPTVRVRQFTTPTTTTTRRPPLQRLVVSQDGRRCTLSTDIQLAQRACRIEYERNNSPVVTRECFPGRDGLTPQCESTATCTVTINNQRVNLFMCSKSEEGQRPRQPNRREPTQRNPGRRGNNTRQDQDRDDQGDFPGGRNPFNNRGGGNRNPFNSGGRNPFNRGGGNRNTTNDNGGFNPFNRGSGGNPFNNGGQGNPQIEDSDGQGQGQGPRRIPGRGPPPKRRGPPNNRRRG